MKTPKITKQDALRYHAEGRPGKIEVVPTKPYRTQRDLALAYSPGVAEPCLLIHKDKEDAYKYTGKGNLVGVISNGTAVLGLGDIGPEASKPVMEGKGVLFKIFADIDVFDIEVDASNPDDFIKAVKAIAPTFGGINLEDIKAPECFEIETRLKQELDIPVMHDDQHGTAIISGAGLLNALALNGKKIEEIKVVVNGAGAAAVSCARLYISLGVNPKNIVMCDSRGVINEERASLSEIKKEFVTDRKVNTLEEALKGADLFLGLSVADILTEEMIKSMADDPIVFALANPNPEISYEKAVAAREDVIMATGRSDYPNQINNVLGFPYIFRGALDVRATAINEDMKIASVHAIAQLAREDVPESVNVAYNAKNINFGRDYIVPKALDPRLISTVATAVAKAAIASGVARQKIKDWEVYKRDLNKKLGIENELIRTLFNKAKRNPKCVVFPEGDNYNIIKAANILVNDGMGMPILLGNKETIMQIADENEVDMTGIKILDVRSHKQSGMRTQYAAYLSEKRARKGLTYKEARERMFNRNYFASMMVEMGDADALISGFSTKYHSALQVALDVIGKKEDVDSLVGVNIMMTKKGPFFFADTTNNTKSTKEALVSTTLCTADIVRRFNMEPKIALISYSNFGSVKVGSPVLMHEVIDCLHKLCPDLIVDGEVSVDIALNKEKRDEMFQFTKLKGEDVNTLIFPNLSAGNTSYKILKELGGVETIGPILEGAAKPVHLVQMGASVRDIVNMAVMAVVDAQGD